MRTYRALQPRTGVVPVTVAVAVCDGVCEGVPVLDAVDVELGVEPGASDAVTVGEMVLVADAVLVALGVTVGVGDGVHRSSMLWARLAVSGMDASVLLLASSTLSVWLMARVLHVLGMPAAVHAAGAVQHVVVCGLRFINVTLYICCGRPALAAKAQLAEARSTCQNSALLVPPEL